MNIGEMLPLVLLLVCLAAIPTIPGFLWARWLRRRALAPRFAARAAFLLLAFAALTPFASVGASHEPPPVGTLGPRLPARSAGGIAQALAQRVLPTPTLSASGNICSVTVGLTPQGVSVGGGCSPENLGTRTTRIVSGRILSEGAL